MITPSLTADRRLPCQRRRFNYRQDGREPEIVDEIRLRFFPRNDLTDLVVDLLEDLLRRLDAGARRRSDMELDHKPPSIAG